MKRSASRVMRVMIDDAEQRRRRPRVLYAILGTAVVVAVLGATSDHRTFEDVRADCEAQGGAVIPVLGGVECSVPAYTTIP